MGLDNAYLLKVLGVHLVCYVGSTLFLAAATGYENWDLPSTRSHSAFQAVTAIQLGIAIGALCLCDRKGAVLDLVALARTHWPISLTTLGSLYCLGRVWSVDLDFELKWAAYLVAGATANLLLLPSLAVLRRLRGAAVAGPPPGRVHVLLAICPFLCIIRQDLLFVGASVGWAVYAGALVAVTATMAVMSRGDSVGRDEEGVWARGLLLSLFAPAALLALVEAAGNIGPNFAARSTQGFSDVVCFFCSSDQQYLIAMQQFILSCQQT